MVPGGGGDDDEIFQDNKNRMARNAKMAKREEKMCQ